MFFCRRSLLNLVFQRRAQMASSTSMAYTRAAPPTIPCVDPARRGDGVGPRQQASRLCRQFGVTLSLSLLVALSPSINTRDGLGCVKNTSDIHAHTYSHGIQLLATHIHSHIYTHAHIPSFTFSPRKPHHRQWDAMRRGHV